MPDDDPDRPAAPARGMPISPEVARWLAAARKADEELHRVRHLLRRHHHERAAEAPTGGQHAADAVASVLGSWNFLIAQSVFLAGWVALNIIAWAHHWDPYPFILLNLMLSFQAAYSAPILLMSSNRQGALDRERASQDYLVNQRSEALGEQLVALVQAQVQQNAEILALLKEGPATPPRP